VSNTNQIIGKLGLLILREKDRGKAIGATLKDIFPSPSYQNQLNEFQLKDRYKKIKMKTFWMSGYPQEIKASLAEAGGFPTNMSGGYSSPQTWQHDFTYKFKIMKTNTYAGNPTKQDIPGLYFKLVRFPYTILIGTPEFGMSMTMTYTDV